jgi:hypothetical protein
VELRVEPTAYTACTEHVSTCVPIGMCVSTRNQIRDQAQKPNDFGCFRHCDWHCVLGARGNRVVDFKAACHSRALSRAAGLCVNCVLTPLISHRCTRSPSTPDLRKVGILHSLDLHRSCRSRLTHRPIKPPFYRQSEHKI